MNDHEVMIISALRYALPRRSYIMVVTEEYINDMLTREVSQNFISVLIQDIEDHYAWNNRNKVEDTLQHNWYPLLGKLKVLVK